MFLEASRRVARDARGGRLSLAQKRALQGALDYLRDAAPNHTLDEEESLFPILRESGTAPSALPLIEQLQKEHKKADRQHLDVEVLGRRWLEEVSLPEESAEQLRATLNSLAAMYRSHIELEDSVLFPLAEKTLSAAEIKALGCEMAARRGIDLDICKI